LDNGFITEFEQLLRHKNFINNSMVKHEGIVSKGSYGIISFKIVIYFNILLLNYIMFYIVLNKINAKYM